MPTQTDCKDEVTKTPYVLIVGSLFAGSAEHREFAGLIRQIESSASVEVVSDCRAARDYLDGASSWPDLVILLRNRPDGMLSRDAIDLVGLASETHFVWLLGSWCEGESHTGRYWDGLEKIHWHQFRRWWDRYRLEFFDHDPSCVELVATRGNQLAVVQTDSVVTFEAITDSLAVAGWSALWQRPQCEMPLVAGVVAGIWDGGQLTLHEPESLRRFCRSLGNQVPVVALLDFPQFDRVQLAHELGATEVLGKPWREDDLIAACGLVGNTASDTTNTETRAKPQAA